MKNDDDYQKEVCVFGKDFISFQNVIITCAFRRKIVLKYISKGGTIK